MKRFYFELENKNGDVIFLEKEELFHLKKVLRLKKDEEVVCFCGDGKDYICKIEKIDSEKALLKVKEVLESNTASKTNLTVFQGSLKLDKFEFIIQKLAELGVKKIVPFESVFSVAKIKQEKIERFKKIAISALKQCKRADFMQIENKLYFNEMLKVLPQFDKVIFAYENENENFIKNLKLEKHQNIAIIIGSEGGFSLKEAESLKNFKNLETVSLGKRVLRAETATIVFSSLIMFLLGEI